VHVDIFIEYLRRNIRHGSIQLTLPDGTHYALGQGQPVAYWVFTNPKAIGRILRDYDLELGETYTEGGWHSNPGGLLTLIEVLMLNFGETKEHGLRGWRAHLYKIFQLGNRIARSYRNVSHHYDIDEWVFRRFLDSNMFYSCAYFEREDQALEDAQLAKCKLIMKKLLLQPGQRVLDIGCGWGGLAFYLAEHADVMVTGITLSKEQLRVARDETIRRCLENKTEFRLQDYREHRGQYDRVVSIGMFEHVGARHFRHFFNQVESLLNPDGIALIHTIGEAHHSSSTNPWIRRHIFPGGYIPSLSEMSRAVEQSTLINTDVEILRLHYARTLSEWLNRFSSHHDEVAERMGETFYRMWEFYLAATCAAFRYWDLVVFHVQLAKRHGSVPIYRDYLLREGVETSNLSASNKSTVPI
jgi:cyclopropane-fatty-acyl-phospholipid synthase